MSSPPDFMLHREANKPTGILVPYKTWLKGEFPDGIPAWAKEMSPEACVKYIQRNYRERPRDQFHT